MSRQWESPRPHVAWRHDSALSSGAAARSPRWALACELASDMSQLAASYLFPHTPHKGCAALGYCQAPTPECACSTEKYYIISLSELFAIC